jgi:hypothetical protein
MVESEWKQPMEIDYDNPRLDKSAFAVVPLFDNSDIDEFWHSRTPNERIDHVLFLRKLNYGAEATARLQRVLEIVKRQGD